MGFAGVFIIYIFGGLTFPLLVLLSIFVHAYYTLPIKDTALEGLDGCPESCDAENDDTCSIKAGRSLHDLAERFQRGHEPDAASGYFAVCREYVPGGVNGKPPERTTPAGSVIAAESPSVYQNMYRSLFDRRQAPTIHPEQENGRTVRRARNVFFVVLRHGHLMLYETSDQMEVKYVIAIEQYNVSIYGGEDEIPEGELWIKRNAIMLSRKSGLEGDLSKPFYLLSENCSEKEDFYVALLQNQEQKLGASTTPPRPLQFEPRLAIGLVQSLHSSEEQLQNRWMNALIGRLFLAMYKTPEMEDYVRKKITKKIARAKKPAFLSDIILRSIDMGESAPQITNPRLKDLTIDGDCCVELDIKYHGGFRLEIATTARIDLGARFKAREVTVILAVVLKKMNGHALIKFKPPPSNRVWLSFESMPDMDMIIEPLVSSRQITYGFILRTIEARIREVLAETVVLPHWDDVPFTNTLHQDFRGGIWAPLASQLSQPLAQMAIPDEAPEDEAEADLEAPIVPHPPQLKDGRIMSMPLMPDHTCSNEATKATSTSYESAVTARNASTSMQKSPTAPKVLRSRSFALAASPLLSMDNANVDSYPGDTDEKSWKPKTNATSAIRTISYKSRPASPPESAPSSVNNVTSPQDMTVTNGDRSSTSSYSSGDSGHKTMPSADSEDAMQASLPSKVPTIDSQFDLSATNSNPVARTLQTPEDTTTLSDKRQTVAAINAATTAAKKWGWGVLNRSLEQRNQSRPDSDRAASPGQPVGRGQPLPPLGQPLPFPGGKRQKSVGGVSGKRKAVPPPVVPQTSAANRSEELRTQLPPPPPLPARRRPSAFVAEDNGNDGLLVVKAPPDVEPESPDKKDQADHSGKSLLTTYDRTSHLRDIGRKSAGEGLDYYQVEAQLPAHSTLSETEKSIDAWEKT